MQLKETIRSVKEQYAIPVYNNENINTIPNKDIQFTINDQLFLDTLLMEIRGRTISYSSYKTKQKKLYEFFLVKIINELEKNGDLEQLELKKTELQNHRKTALQGSIVRSRIKWIEEGEKPSKYFLSLENRNFTSKIIPKLIGENGSVISDQREILSETSKFYRQLYTEQSNTENVNLEDLFKNINTPKLSEEEAEGLEGPVTYNELLQTLKEMKNNKSPGSDGYTAEFFKFFWNDIGHFVVKSINSGYDNGEMSITQKQGIIICLPKGDKPRQYLKNWRPITLLNIIYKLAAGAIASRFKKVLPKLIHTDQTGFIPGRCISENTRLIYDVLDYTEKHNIAGLLLLIDFEKAFDSVSWRFIHETLSYFKFGPSIKRWIQTFQNNISSSINQGGNLSSFFKVERGCRQGDPVSSYIFILCAEILALKLRNNNNIKGIEINNQEILLSQFADDTCLILDGKEKSFNTAIKELDYFAKISGLRINFQKTQVIWIGSKRYSNDRLGDKYGVQWGKTRFCYLGIEFDVDLTEIVRLNYDKKLVKLKVIIKSWSRRNISPIGRCVVLKSLAITQFNHLFLSIPDPSDHILKEINQTLYEFLWNSKIDKIKRNIITKDYDQGGIKMIDIYSFIASLKSTWIRRLFIDDNKTWKTIIEDTIDTRLLANCGDSYIDVCIRNVTNAFWRDVLKYQKRILNIMEGNEDIQLMTPIWYNSRLQIDGQPIFYKEWYNKGVRYINDTLTETGELLTYDQFCETYNIRTNFLTYQTIRSKIAEYLRKKNFKFSHKVPFPNLPQNIQIFLQKKKGTKPMYTYLTGNSTKPTAQRKWAEKGFQLNSKEWENIYRSPFYTTKNPKLHWLQFRVNHRIIATNNFLTKIGKINNPICYFCETERETLEHLFWECSKTQHLIEEFKRLTEAYNIIIQFNKTEFILGYYTTRCQSQSMDNYILLLMKFYIYKSRCSNEPLSLNRFRDEIKKAYRTGKYAASITNSVEQYKQPWLKWLCTFHQ